MAEESGSGDFTDRSHAVNRCTIRYNVFMIMWSTSHCGSIVCSNPHTSQPAPQSPLVHSSIRPTVPHPLQPTTSTYLNSQGKTDDVRGPGREDTLRLLVLVDRRAGDVTPEEQGEHLARHDAEEGEHGHTAVLEFALLVLAEGDLVWWWMGWHR